MNEIWKGFVEGNMLAYRLLMCLPLAVAWMLLYGLIVMTYGVVRGDMFMMAWMSFVNSDVEDMPEFAAVACTDEHCACDPSGSTTCPPNKKGLCGCG